MHVSHPRTLHVAAVLIATTAALAGRAWLEVRFLSSGLPKHYAADLAYLVVPPALLVLLYPVLRQDWRYILDRFSLARISARGILNAFLIGVLLRMVYWAHLLVGTSFGIYRNDDPLAVEGPIVFFQCAAPHVVLLGFAVMAITVPVIEEVTYRGYLQSMLRTRGPVIAVSLSALVFAFFHSPAHWPTTFVAGVVFGIQYWRTDSLWPAVISHATVNAIVQIDWRCLNIRWNPGGSDIPAWLTGTTSAAVLLASLAGIAWLLSGQKHRGEQAPRY